MAGEAGSLSKGFLITALGVAAVDLVLYAALHFTSGGATIGLGLAQFLDPVFQIVGLSAPSKATMVAVGSSVPAINPMDLVPAT
jgi:hypothetical protein